MKGFGIIEVLVAAVIVSLVLVGVHATTTQALRLVHQSTKRTQAAFLAEETVEAIRSLRDESWSTNIAPLTSGTNYFLAWNGTKWITTTTNTLIDGIFERKFVLANVNRDANDDIATTGTLDPDTKKATITVLWGSVASEAISESYETGTLDTNLAAFPENSGFGDPAQSFVVPAGSDITVPRAELYIKRATADPSDVFLEIRSGGVQGAVLATSNTLDSATLSSSLAWTSFAFATPPTLTTGTTYYLRLRSIPDSAVAFSGAVGTIHWGYGWPGTYGSGDAYRYVGPSDNGDTLTGYDFSFRVYKQATITSEHSIELVTYITDMFGN
ncbi:MAG: Uncharacterized protein G01um101470_747 [Parcubacteria group bacterium Gr01-1014_70]|nr:MAG: Uncharacterized protein G01um101470_747 [Parcubacteria group bacterium Gr01-1014_70]